MFRFEDDDKQKMVMEMRMITYSGTVIDDAAQTQLLN